MKWKPAVTRLKPPQFLVFGFIGIIAAGTLLLSLPIASRDGQVQSFINALFTATSATCVTGLTVVNISGHFTYFGQVVIMLLVQIGGIGFMTMATLFAFAFRKKISLRERLILQQAMNQNNIEGIVRLVRRVIIYSLIIEATAAIIFTIRWSFEMSLGKATYFGVFHAISFFNNAGFDLFGKSNSIADYVNDPIVNLVTVVLIIFGGIGFIVIADLVDFRKTKRLLLHSKVVVVTTFALIAFGTVMIFIFEFTNSATLGSLNGMGKALASFFQAVTPRSAGVSTLDIGSFRQATQFLIIILMFIGASPGSTGGGIKTTTLAILAGAVIAMFKGRDEIVLFQYRLAKDRLLKAMTLTLAALFVIIFVSMVLSTTEDHAFLMILFETTSAFSTTGLSTGLTMDLTGFGKVMIILTMIVGRLGPLTFAYAIGPKHGKELYRHPEGKMIIG